MSFLSPKSPMPPVRQIYISRVESPSEEHEELNKMAHGVVAESQRWGIEGSRLIFHYLFTTIWS